MEYCRSSNHNPQNLILTIGMNATDAQKQTSQMVQFIISEAQDKAQEIEAKALEEFNIQKLKQVQMMKDKIRQEFAKRSQAQESARAVAKSTAINNARLLKVQARQRCIDTACDAALAQLQDVTQKKDKYKQIITDLIVQGLLRLLEPTVLVRCRECDKSIVSSVLSDAGKKYTEVLKSKGIPGRSVSLSIDTVSLNPAPSADSNRGNIKKFLEEEKSLLARDPKVAEEERKKREKESRRNAKMTVEAIYCTGGVILMSANGRISVDNTFDARLNLLKEECKPRIRFTMFPSLQPEKADVEAIKYREQQRASNKKFIASMVKGGKFALKK